MMLASKRGKRRGYCPECRTPVRLAEDELDSRFTCNICGTSFSVRRERRRRRKDGYVKYDLADVEWLDPRPRGGALRPVRWVLFLLAFAGLLALVAFYGDKIPEFLRGLFYL